MPVMSAGSRSGVKWNDGEVAFNWPRDEVVEWALVLSQTGAPRPPWPRAKQEISMRQISCPGRNGGHQVRETGGWFRSGS